MEKFCNYFVFSASEWLKSSLTMENSDFQEAPLSVGGGEVGSTVQMT